jgi:hypothetical protein
MKVQFNNTHQLDTLHIHFHPPKLRSCSASWGWANDARNMSRLWVLIKWKWMWSVSSWCLLLNYTMMHGQQNIKVRYESVAGSTVSISLHELHHIISLINSAVSPQDGGSRFLWNTGVYPLEYILLLTGSQLSATWERRFIVLAEVWIQYFLSTAQ